MQAQTPVAPWSTGLFDCFDDVESCKIQIKARIRSALALDHGRLLIACICVSDHLITLEYIRVRAGCVTWLCPCITFGQVAEIVDRGSTSCGVSAALYALIIALTGSGFGCIYSCFYRSKLRAQYGLQESPCPDCCVHFCCEFCALCQEYRELKNRGFEMSIGWHANMERQGHAAATMPPQMHAGMTR
ncbi:unnamed protein product [Urochloa decumbens]|uniref:Uncharacterized protein n=1 Tax=Urochloa decumbens TaxID=240449 RepID=A0ABC9CK13_9POAL